MAVWDIEVEEDHSYYCQGIFHHNSKAPNLQNIPKRSKIGKKIRAAFIPAPGMKWVSADFSQIELRILAHYSKDPYMREIYARRGDIHTMTGLKAFGISEAQYAAYDDAARKEFEDYKRLPCKNVNFGIVYGLTPIGLQAQLALSGIYWTEDECADFIARWFGVFIGVEPYMQEQRYRVRKYGYVWDMWGRVRWCPGIHSAIEKVREESLREAGNMPIQASSAGMTKLAMAEMWERDQVLWNGGVDMNPLLTIHDEVIYECEEGFASDLLELNLALMRNVTTLDHVPIDADGKVKDRW